MLKKNAALIWTLSKTGVTPHPPPQFFFGSFGSLFGNSKLLVFLVHFCAYLVTQYFVKKGPKTFGFGQSPLSSRIKKNGSEKVSQNVWFASEKWIRQNGAGSSKVEIFFC